MFPAHVFKFSRRALLFVFLSVIFLAGGCSTVTTEKISKTLPELDESKPRVVARERVRRSDDYVVLIAEASDTYKSLAATYLGDEKLDYIISEFNDNKPVVAGSDVAIPLKPVNPGGLYADGYLTVPVLCYHQFSPNKSSNKLIISNEAFDRQMSYLKNNGYNVITLKQLLDFIEYRRRPPPKSVVITIDDGWKTVRTIAYPTLKKYGFSAVLFVYTNLIKSRQSSVTLSWDDLQEMVDSGVIEVESHTASHADLTKLSEEQVNRELRDSQQSIKSRLGVTPVFLAYPYGNFNDKTVEIMRTYGYKGGFTVIRGATAFFHNNFSLNRSMVFNSEKIEDFTKLLETFRYDRL